MLTHWIWFAHRPGVSDRLKAVLMEHFCDPEDIFYADEAALRGLPELTREALEGLLDKNLTSSEEILESCDPETAAHPDLSGRRVSGQAEKYPRPAYGALL